MERPTVATRVGGIPESVRHEETGLLVPPADPVALAAAIERLLANRAKAAVSAPPAASSCWSASRSTRTGADLAALYERVAPVS